MNSSENINTVVATALESDSVACTISKYLCTDILEMVITIDVFVQTIQLSHLNRRIRNRPLETARATHLHLSFQCIKETPVMMSSAIIIFIATFLSYAQLVH